MRQVILCLSLLIFACKSDTKQVSAISYRGETMGTFYSIKFLTNKPIPQEKIDTKLKAFNANFSTYIEDAQISVFNNSKDGIHTLTGIEANEFEEVFVIADKIYKSTNGKFDPTVKPLVDYWGFGKEKKPRKHKPEEIASLLKLVGFDQIQLKRKGENVTLTKTNPKIELDFSAIAKGFGVDKVAELLESDGVENYMVEIGGETSCKGVNKSGNKWTLGISEPNPDAAPSKAIIKIQPGDMAVASSGNYRSYYEVDGRIFNHTIDPISGMAFPSDLLAITVIASDCTTADAIATACMAMGKKDSEKYINVTEKVEACFFYEKEAEIMVDYSTNFEQYIVN